MTIHPVIRVVLFLTFAAFTAYGQTGQLVTAAALMLFLFVMKPQWLQKSWPMLKRMRWLFFSIVILYLGFTPGLPAFSDWPWSPSKLGFQLALLRTGALVLLVMAVNVLLASMEREQLIGAILWLVYPFRWIVDDKKLAIRISLTLELIEEVTMLNSMVMQTERPPQGNNALMRRIAIIGDRVALLFEAVLDKANNMASHTLEITARRAPPTLQWVYPLLLGILFAMVLTWY